MRQNSQTKNVIKLKKLKKWQSSKGDKTYKTKMWQNSKTLNVAKLKNSKRDKNHLKMWQTQNVKMGLNLKS